jgi:hypothetical protein
MVALGALLLAGTAALVVAGTGAARPVDASAAQADIRALAVTRHRALVDADMATLEKIHAGDYQLITQDGSVLSKADFLGSVQSGDLNYLTFRPILPIRVRLPGDAAAAVRYESHIDIVAGLGRIANDSWHTDIYQRRLTGRR